MRATTQWIMARSRAFSFELDYAPAIWLNRSGAFAQGCVSDADAPALLADLALSSCVHGAAPIPTSPCSMP